MNLQRLLSRRHSTTASQKSSTAQPFRCSGIRSHSTRLSLRSLALLSMRPRAYSGSAGAGAGSPYTRDWRKLRLLAAAIGGVGAAVLLSNYARGCGIVGYVGPEPAVGYLLEGIQILQNRGYDSAGLCTITADGRLVVTKYASAGSTSDSIDLLVKNAPARHSKDKIGISHTRWATHGGKTDVNAHPHTDQKQRVALVHNGTIENADEIKAELQAKGVKFKSQTDTEVIAQLIGASLDEGLDFMPAVKKALGKLEGTWGLAIIHKDKPGEIIAARHGSPLVIGIGKDAMFVASEVHAFSRHTQQYISLKDDEVVSVKLGGNLDVSRIETAPTEVMELSPAPYAHWTLKEIMEQPDAIQRTLGAGSRFDGNTVKLGGLQDNAALLLGIQNLVIAACGTSYFAGLYGARLMRSLKCFESVQVFDASEVTADNFSPKSGGCLVISQSGETKDTHRALVTAENLLLPRFSIVNQVGSLIARTTNCGVYLNAGREHAVASTKAFTTQVTALAMVAGWFAQNRPTSKDGAQRRTEMLDSLHRLPVYAGMTLRLHEQCKGIANKLKDKQHMFILGKGYAEPIAYEGALKIKEITYVHAEGYSGGALKHGPFALLDKGTPVILMVLDDQHAELMRIAAAEVKARGTYNIVITDKPSLAAGIADEVVVIPSNGPMTALLATVPLQLIAYEMAIKKGHNPDKPRNLAKAVTVD